MTKEIKKKSSGSIHIAPSKYFEYFEKDTSPISKYFWKRHDFK